MTSLIWSTQQEWTWSIHPESDFKVLTPSALLHDVTEVPTTVDFIQYHQYHVGSVADSSLAMAFVIDHYVMPKQDQAPDAEYLRDFFENTIDELLVSLNGSLIYMDFISSSGQELCIWKATYQKGNGIIRGHCILTGNKYYGLQVFGLKKNKPDLLMSKFLDSFKLLGNTSP